MKFFFKRFAASKYVYFSILSIIISLPLLYHAFINKLFNFDEAYYFIASYQFGEHGRFFIDFDPSSYLKNTKPYLFVFFQALSGRVLGWSELSLRLPTLLSSFLLIWTVILSPEKIIKSRYTLWGMCSGLLLLTAPFFINPHMAITGDHDIPLTLFTTLFLLTFYLFITHNERSTLYAFLLCLFAALSILTKGWMILFFMPACLIYLLTSKKTASLLTNKGFILGLLLAVCLISAWYIGRELVDPGYLKAVWSYEIGRYNDADHPLNSEWSYYWVIIVTQQFKYWILFLIPSLIYILSYPKSAEKHLLLFLLLQTISFLLLLSFSKVKLPWYNAPILPLLILLIGFGISFVIHLSLHFCKSTNHLLGFIAIILLFSYPYYTLFHKKFDRYYTETYGSFMISKYPNTAYTIVKSTTYNPHLIFYNQRVLNLFHTKHPIKTTRDTFQINEKILVCEPVIMLDIKRHYYYSTIDSSGNCILLKIEKERH